MKDNKISGSGGWGWDHMTDHMAMILHRSDDHDITFRGSVSYKFNERRPLTYIKIICYLITELQPYNSVLYYPILQELQFAYYCFIRLVALKNLYNILYKTFALTGLSL